MNAKMKRKIGKILCITFLIGMVLFYTNAVLASTIVGQVAGDVSAVNDVSEGKSFIKKVIDPVLSAVRIVAVGIGIIMITVLGIQYMVAAPDEKANIKTKLIVFTVGAIVVFAAATIVQKIQAVAGDMFSN